MDTLTHGRDLRIGEIVAYLVGHRGGETTEDLGFKSYLSPTMRVQELKRSSPVVPKYTTIHTVFNVKCRKISGNDASNSFF